MSWKEELMKAFNEGKTIQSNHNTGVWRDFKPQNQVDRPNFNYGNENNWRIKPTERTGIPFPSQQIVPEDENTHEQIEHSFIEKKYSKDEMLLFAGFCVGRKRVNPGVTGQELWQAWETDFGHE